MICFNTVRKQQQHSRPASSQFRRLESRARCARFSVDSKDVVCKMSNVLLSPVDNTKQSKEIGTPPWARNKEQNLRNIDFRATIMIFQTPASRYNDNNDHDQRRSRSQVPVVHHREQAATVRDRCHHQPASRENADHRAHNFNPTTTLNANTTHQAI